MAQDLSRSSLTTNQVKVQARADQSARAPSVAIILLPDRPDMSGLYMPNCIRNVTVPTADLEALQIDNRVIVCDNKVVKLHRDRREASLQNLAPKYSWQHHTGERVDLRFH